MPVRIDRPPASRLEEGTALARLRAELENPAATLAAVGAALVAESHKAFRTERWAGRQWQQRVNPNWPGVLADLQSSSEPKARRFRDRPVLRDTGLLARSFAWARTGADEVEAGTVVRYAQVLHAGGTSKSPPVTEEVQKRLWAWIRRTRSRVVSAARSAGKAAPGEAKEKADARLGSALGRAEAADRLRWLLSPSLRGQRIDIEHPARPMVGLPATLVEDVERYVGVSIRVVS